MQGLIQRVTHANVVIDQQLVGEIKQGIVLLLGVEKEDDLYEVDKIVDESKDRYKIRWVGYKPSDDTWQLKSEIRKSVPLIVKEWVNSKV